MSAAITAIGVIIAWRAFRQGQAQTAPMIASRRTEYIRDGMGRIIEKYEEVEYSALPPVQTRVVYAPAQTFRIVARP
ncbi:MAG: hypothetical protein PHZ19_07630 [Candidatus Thermoplasmatota archaeon]|nr:hypothetical protein [Candidatus Thermoplasmatota archaeon]